MVVLKMRIRTYSELITIPSFIERYRYLRLGGRVGEQTFGFDRYLNQVFYSSDPEWLAVRRKVILRDNGCDLGIEDREIFNRIIVHHMNPITKEDLIYRTKFLLDPEYLISTIKNTHDAIHYGDESLLLAEPIIRTKNDTCPWRRG
jgi:hypothetical protein